MARTTLERLFDSFFLHKVPLALQRIEGVRDACRDAFMEGRRSGRTPPMGRKPKFGMLDVVNICASYYGSKASVSDIARMHRVSPGVITKIIEGKYIPNLDL